MPSIRDALIQILQSTRSVQLPQFVTLELLSRCGDLWVVTWSGATSASSAIEISSIDAEKCRLPSNLRNAFSCLIMLRNKLVSL
ncbi:hypothetical protein L6164_036941 [Bauhinia variegata]|uniref:Uncharacterized protein n=1 Tax=Bauhinia variegata TaxID=167791 RepID=A0ACB9KIJ8_BAUVA|nr:hypothetical protein L6164_036941 [Bauhinia variegata]